jgi:superfamily II DNA helicase RecQ
VAQDISEGKFSALIVQPEQLSMLGGHLPRLARLIEQDRFFRKRIVRVHVDEAHFIYLAGLGLYGLPAFRPAWGKLGEFRVKLRKGVVFQALSGTQPKHIKKTIIEHLLFNEEKLCSIKLSSNRPNTVYATHPIVGDLLDFQNLDFLIPDPYPHDMQLPKTLVFHDNVDECTSAAA